MNIMTKKCIIAIAYGDNLMGNLSIAQDFSRAMEDICIINHDNRYVMAPQQESILGQYIGEPTKGNFDFIFDNYINEGDDLIIYIDDHSVWGEGVKFYFQDHSVWYQLYYYELNDMIQQNNLNSCTIVLRGNKSGIPLNEFTGCCVLASMREDEDLGDNMDLHNIGQQLINLGTCDLETAHDEESQRLPPYQHPVKNCPS